MTTVALTIAGSDPSGGAGIQADLKTFHQHGVYGEAVVALLTVQNTRRVSEVRVLDAAFVQAQVRAVLEDIPPAAAKTGALGGVDIIEMIAAEAASFVFPLVVDPVMVSKHGAALMAEDAVAALREQLLPRATLVTPNLHEAALLAGMDVIQSVAAMKAAAQRIADHGAGNVLVKGGHLEGVARDVLFTDGSFEEFSSQRIDSIHTHGTGCALSAAIAANLALGLELIQAVSRAKRFITRAIETAPRLGGGQGPTNLSAATD